MEQKAAAMSGLDESLKRSRDEMKPLREELISAMQAAGADTVPAGGGKVFKLVQKSTRKAVGSRMIFGIIEEKIGKDAAVQVKAACEMARGDPKVKVSLKLQDIE